MESTLVLAVPETVTSTFVVAAPRTTVDHTSVIAAWSKSIPWGHLRGKPGTISVHRTDIDSNRNYADVGNPAELIRRVDEGGRGISVTADGWPGWPARPAVASHGIANALALESGGVVLDPMTGVLFEPIAQPEYDFDGPRMISVINWCNLTYTGKYETMMSAGLRRFGIPEVVTGELSAELGEDWVFVLAATAKRVLNQFWLSLERDPDLAFVEIENPLAISSDLVLAEKGVTPPADVESVRREVRLRLDPLPSGLSYIDLLPPPDFRGSRDQWLYQTIRVLTSPLR